METLNLRWEELGVKEAQLKAHIQKFEQFIQVPAVRPAAGQGHPHARPLLRVLSLLFLFALADSSPWVRSLSVLSNAWGYPL